MIGDRWSDEENANEPDKALLLRHYRAGTWCYFNKRFCFVPEGTEIREFKTVKNRYECAIS